MIRNTGIQDLPKQSSGSKDESCLKGLGATLKSQDMFSEQFAMRIDGGEQALGSGMGTFCSLILLLITVVYAVLKMKVLEARKDDNILQATKDLYFTDDDVFSYDEHRLNWAVAFTAFNSNTEYELPAEYGEIVFKTLMWGVEADGTPFSRLVEVPQHTCTKDELAINGADHPDAAFFEVHESAEWYIKTYQKKFRCFDTKDLTVFGDFSTFKAR